MAKVRSSIVRFPRESGLTFDMLGTSASSQEATYLRSGKLGAYLQGLGPP